jgi:cytochrome c oxidase assembly protein Cox11
MKAVPRIRTKPSLFQRIVRHEAGFVCLLFLAMFAFLGLYEMICTLFGVPAIN